MLKQLRFLVILGVSTAMPLVWGRAQGTGPAGAGSDPVQGYLQGLVDSHTLAGAVVVFEDKNGILYRKAVGYRDLGARVPMEANDVFWIASMSKPMTATAFMMLVDEGKVSVDEPVEKYLPEFKGMMVLKKGPDGKPDGTLEPAAHPILIRELLSHTSGLRMTSAIEHTGGGMLDRTPLYMAVHSYTAEPLMTQPGTAYSYANEGINTVGRIIEVVSGMPYERFMQERIFDPLGMTETTFWPSAKQIGRLAKSYKLDKQTNALMETPLSQTALPLDDRTRRYPFPAGGLFSTATDVGKFCRMILNGGAVDGKRYISGESLKAMTTLQTGKLAGDHYGFGWKIKDDGFGHDGAYKTAMYIDPKAGRAMVFMVQEDGPWGTPQGDAMIPTLRKMANAMSAGR